MEGVGQTSYLFLCFIIELFSIKPHKGRKLCYDLQEEWVVKNVVMSGTNACDVTLPKKNSRKGKKPGRGGKKGKRKGNQKKGRLN